MPQNPAFPLCQLTEINLNRPEVQGRVFEGFRSPNTLHIEQRSHLVIAEIAMGLVIVVGWMSIWVPKHE